MNIRNIIIYLIALFIPLAIRAQLSAIDSLAVIHAATAENSGKIQQEMIYLHLDNTSYYRGDRIFFACYLVTSGKLKPSNLSQTIYVELLNPNGKIIDRCVLKPVDGRCHGSLLADETPFYSGYYEIRAYTRYMLNFGPEAIFSRVIPIYAAPKKEGDWAERTILKHNAKTLPMLRPKPRKVDKIELKFYPEGGHLVSGLPARVAFELTDGSRRPLGDVVGRIFDRSNDSVVATFRSGHMGRGTIDFTPHKRRYSAEVSLDGKRYWCDLPEVEVEGVALRVNNRQETDSIEITISRTPNCSTDAIGVSLTCRGELYGRRIVDLSEQTTATFKMPIGKLPSGVAQLTLFNAAGLPIADRMFFHNRHEFVNVEYTFDKEKYRPFEKVELLVKTTNTKSGEPVSVPFSISVADANNHVSYGSNMMAELLLSSEIRGYVHNPAYYFEEGNEEDLDNLLMVQGWRRYSWSQLAGMEPIRIDSLPEQCIEVRGQVLERLRNKPKPGISVSAMLAPVDSTNIFGSTAKAYTFKTDEDGRFILRDSIFGNYMMILSSTNKSKVSNNRILLDMSERPEPKSYDPGELLADFRHDEKKASHTSQEDEPAISLADGTKMLKEVEVTAKYTPAWWSAHYMENSIASYDVAKEISALRDNGATHLRTLADVLPEMDKNFSRGDGFNLTYNGKKVLLVADPEFGSNNGLIDELMGVVETISLSDGTNMTLPRLEPGAIPADYIRNIYINTQQETLMTYAIKLFERTGRSRFDMAMEAYRKFGCVVFIEFHPDKRSKLQNGIRRDVIEGYSTSYVDFYQPDYSVEPPIEPDYRRTLYWNPTVIPDENGIARIRFYNNGTATSFNVTASCISNDGELGTLF